MDGAYLLRTTHPPERSRRVFCKSVCANGNMLVCYVCVSDGIGQQEEEEIEREKLIKNETVSFGEEERVVSDEIW